MLLLRSLIRCCSISLHVVDSPTTLFIPVLHHGLPFILPLFWVTVRWFRLRTTLPFDPSSLPHVYLALERSDSTADLDPSTLICILTFPAPVVYSPTAFGHLHPLLPHLLPLHTFTTLRFTRTCPALPRMPPASLPHAAAPTLPSHASPPDYACTRTPRLPPLLPLLPRATCFLRLPRSTAASHHAHHTTDFRFAGSSAARWCRLHCYSLPVDSLRLRAGYDRLLIHLIPSRSTLLPTLLPFGHLTLRLTVLRCYSPTYVLLRC